MQQQIMYNMEVTRSLFGHQMGGALIDLIGLIGLITSTDFEISDN